MSEIFKVARGAAMSALILAAGTVGASAADFVMATGQQGGWMAAVSPSPSPTRSPPWTA